MAAVLIESTAVSLITSRLAEGVAGGPSMRPRGHSTAWVPPWTAGAGRHGGWRGTSRGRSPLGRRHHRRLLTMSTAHRLGPCRFCLGAFLR